jgi:magnesium transporter
MISKYTYKTLTWIDLSSPTKEEVRALSEEYKVPELVRDEILTPTLRSKVDLYDNLIFLILHFPILPASRPGQNIEQEIDFVIGKNFIITTHYEPIPPLEEFAKMFDKGSALEKRNLSEHAGFLFYFIMKELYRYSMTELDKVNESLHEIETKIFEGHEAEMVEKMSSVNRILIDYKQALRFHREVLLSFESAATDFFGAHFAYYLSSIIGEYNKVQSILDGHREILGDLRETNDSLLTTKTNDTIKKLTIMTFIILPLTFITGVFGMNMNMVFISSTADFVKVISAMLIIALAMFVYFKGKKWF